MVTVPAQIIDNEDGTGEVRWIGLENEDDGAPVALGRYVDKAVQVVGTFGVGGEVTMEGSNDPDIADPAWAPLVDVSGEPIEITGDNDLRQIQQNPRLIRPDVTGGDVTTDVDVIVFFATRGQ
jgi:hypothetical protein